MAIYNFDINQYFNKNNHINIMVKYNRSIRKLTKIKVSEDLDIPFTTYRRLEDDTNYKNEEYLKKAAEYFNIDTEIDDQLIISISKHFNEFYNFTYFGDIEKQNIVYEKLMNSYDKCKNNVLLITMHLTRFIYLMSNVQMSKKTNEINESLEILDFFYDYMILPHKILYNSYLCGYYSFKKDVKKLETLVPITLRLAENDEILKSVFIYYLSTSYFFLRDWSKSLYFALKIKNIFEDTNNFNRLVYLKYNLAMIFYKLLNYDESITILTKILNWTSVVPNERLEFNSKLLRAFCYIRLNNYVNAKEIINELYISNKDNGELMMVLLFLYYKLGDKQKVTEYYELIKNSFNQDELFEGYYHFSNFIMLLFEKKEIKEIRKAYISLDNLINTCYTNFVDVIIDEYDNYLQSVNS